MYFSAREVVMEQINISPPQFRNIFVCSFHAQSLAGCKCVNIFMWFLMSLFHIYFRFSSVASNPAYR